MAQDRTAGFDMLVQVSEAELNTQLATAFIAGTVIPPSMSIPVDISGATGTADVNFGLPTLDLDRSRPQVGLTLPFSGSKLELTAPLPLTVEPLSGSILIVDAVQIVAEARSQAAVLDFAGGAPTVTVDFDAASEARLAPLLAAVGMSIAQAENAVAGLVRDHLRTSVRRVLLTPFIPVSDDSDPTTIYDLDVTTVNDTSAVDRGAGAGRLPPGLHPGGRRAPGAGGALSGGHPVAASPGQLSPESSSGPGSPSPPLPLPAVAAAWSWT